MAELNEKQTELVYVAFYDYGTMAWSSPMFKDKKTLSIWMKANSVQYEPKDINTQTLIEYC